MPENTQSLLALIQSGWAQLMAIAGIIWWGRKVDLRTQDHCERLDRHEARLTGFEQTQQAQALQLARIEEGLKAIQITLDRIYSEMRDKP